MQQPKISVIVPIYGVENYIERCVRSLFAQTFHDLEYIFVNDCTLDNSINILNNLIEEYNIQDKVKLVNHDTNLGLAAARNTGLNLSIGKYIFHCDSDDYLELDALKRFYSYAEEYNADVVFSDWYLTFDKTERYMSQDIYSGNSEISQYNILEASLTGKLKYNVWNKLILRDLYFSNNIMFPSGYDMGEDMTIIKLLVHAKKITYLEFASYHYVRSNLDAYTQSLNKRKVEQILYNTDSVVKYVLTFLPKDFQKLVEIFKLNIKLPFLISLDTSNYELWNNCFSESNRYINDKKFFNFRNRLIQNLAINKKYNILKLYNFFFLKIVYGLLYK